jgi:hypothetical protein
MNAPSDRNIETATSRKASPLTVTNGICAIADDLNLLLKTLTSSSIQRKYPLKLAR